MSKVKIKDSTRTSFMAIYCILNWHQFVANLSLDRLTLEVVKWEIEK